MRSLAAALLLGFVVLLGCDAASSNKLVGEWSSDDLLTLIFDDDGTGIWSFGAPSADNAYSFYYAYDENLGVDYLVLNNFDNDEMRAVALHGIVAFEGENQFKVDWEPNAVGSKRTVVPSEFDPEQTLVFTKKVEQ